MVLAVLVAENVRFLVRLLNAMLFCQLMLSPKVTSVDVTALPLLMWRVIFMT